MRRSLLVLFVLLFACVPAYPLTVGNETGGALAKHKVVYITGYSTDLENAIVDLADADDGGKVPPLGITRAAIGDDERGTVYTGGILWDIDLSGYALNDMLYLSTTAGEITDTASNYPVGRVLYAAVGGWLLIDINAMTSEMEAAGDLGGTFPDPTVDDTKCTGTAEYLDGTGTCDTLDGVEDWETPTDDGTLIGNGATFDTKVLPDCDDGSGHINYDTATNAWSCGTAGAGEAPADVTYLVKTADAGLSDEYVTSDGDGIVFNWSVGSPNTLTVALDKSEMDEDHCVAYAAADVGYFPNALTAQADGSMLYQDSNGASHLARFAIRPPYDLYARNVIIRSVTFCYGTETGTCWFDAWDLYRFNVSTKTATAIDTNTSDLNFTAGDTCQAFGSLPYVMADYETLYVKLEFDFTTSCVGYLYGLYVCFDHGPEP